MFTMLLNAVLSYFIMTSTNVYANRMLLSDKIEQMARNEHAQNSNGKKYTTMKIKTTDDKTMTVNRKLWCGSSDQIKYFCDVSDDEDEMTIPIQFTQVVLARVNHYMIWYQNCVSQDFKSKIQYLMSMIPPIDFLRNDQILNSVVDQFADVFNNHGSDAIDFLKSIVNLTPLPENLQKCADAATATQTEDDFDWNQCRSLIEVLESPDETLKSQVFNNHYLLLDRFLDRLNDEMYYEMWKSDVDIAIYIRKTHPFRDVSCDEKTFSIMYHVPLDFYCKNVADMRHLSRYGESNAIVCDGSGHIYAINLDKLHCHGSIDLTQLPNELRELKAKGDKELYLRGTNTFSGSLDLRSLPPNIDHLDLNGNSFEGSVDLSSLPPSLTALHLGSNKLSGEIVLSLPSNSKLSSLSLDHNQFTAVTIESKAQRLRFIGFENNKIQTVKCKNFEPSDRLNLQLTENLIQPEEMNRYWFFDSGEDRQRFFELCQKI